MCKTAMRYIQIIIHIYSLCSLAMLFLLPANRYKWMEDLDPSLPGSSIQDLSGNGSLFGFVLVVSVFLAQGFLILKNPGSKGKWISAGFIALTLAAWFFKAF